MPALMLTLAILLHTAPTWAAEGDLFLDLDMSDPAALQEASRVLEEEIRLAARPQTYLLIDLVSGFIWIKARGVDLHRLPIAAWSVTVLPRLTGTFRLQARPPVVRRRIDPSATIEQEPISLADMPTAYRLSFTPEMIMTIESLAEEGIMGWLHVTSRKVWKQLLVWGQYVAEGRSSVETPTISMTLSSEHAQSLAWSTVDGMQVVVRRPPQP